MISDLTPRPQPPSEHLLHDCLALGSPAQSHRPAILRLEEALGPELARRLVATLTIGSRGDPAARPRTV